MNKWLQAAQRRKAEIDAAEEMAADLKAMLDALPPGQKKKLLEDERCGAIIRKHMQEVKEDGEEDGEDHQLAQLDEQLVAQ